MHAVDRNILVRSWRGNEAIWTEFYGREESGTEQYNWSQISLRKRSRQRSANCSRVNKSPTATSHCVLLISLLLFYLMFKAELTPQCLMYVTRTTEPTKRLLIEQDEAESWACCHVQRVIPSMTVGAATPTGRATEND